MDAQHSRLCCNTVVLVVTAISLTGQWLSIRVSLCCGVEGSNPGAGKCLFIEISRVSILSCLIPDAIIVQSSVFAPAYEQKKTRCQGKNMFFYFLFSINFNKGNCRDTYNKDFHYYYFFVKSATKNRQMKMKFASFPITVFHRYRRMPVEVLIFWSNEKIHLWKILASPEEKAFRLLFRQKPLPQLSDLLGLDRNSDDFSGPQKWAADLVRDAVKMHQSEFMHEPQGCQTSK